MKTSKNYLRNQTLRRNNPDIRKIVNEKIVSRWSEPDDTRSYAEEANAAEAATAEAAPVGTVTDTTEQPSSLMQRSGQA